MSAVNARAIGKKTTGWKIRGTGFLALNRRPKDRKINANKGIEFYRLAAQVKVKLGLEENRDASLPTRVMRAIVPPAN